MGAKVSDLLDAASHHAVPVVRGVRDDQLDRPTPCPDYTVRGLLNHLFHVVVGFQARAAGEQADFGTTPDYLEQGWRDRFELETRRLVAAWAAPGTEERVSGSMKLPGRTLGRMALLDLTVHPWDLARATGQDYTPDPASVQEVTALVAEIGPMARQNKVFDQAVPLPDHASEFDQLLCATGRDPAWPGAA